MTPQLPHFARRGWLWLSLVLVTTSSVVFAGGDIELPDAYLPVPIVDQLTDYSCGAATTYAVLLYWQAIDTNKYKSETDLHTLLETDPQQGTAPKSMVKAIRNFGLKAHYRQGLTVGDLRKALVAGKTLIVDLQAWRTDEKLAWKDLWDDGHYVVAVAIDADTLYVMDPSTPGTYAYVPLSELMDRWHDYETRDGKAWKNHQLAIFVKGQKPDKSFQAPKQVSKME